MRRLLLAALISLGTVAPAGAEEFRISRSSAYQPWLAAGLTYVPVVPASIAATMTTNPSDPLRWRDSAGFVALNPMPGLGHAYVGEPLRGLGFWAASMGMLGATLVANVSLYQGPRPSDASTPWQDQVRGGVNLAYFATSTALSAWAAWDAYRIAETKNRQAMEQAAARTAAAPHAD